MKALLLTLVLLTGVTFAPAASGDAPTESPLLDVFVDVDPCTGLEHVVTISGTFFRHSHAAGATYHAERSVTTSAGYVGRGIEISVDHERIVVINDVLSNPSGDRVRAHVVVVLEADRTARVDQFRLTCIGRNR